MSKPQELVILGSRGVPARHGGFETLAERLSIYLTENGWRVTVYCQESSLGSEIDEDEWKGVRRVRIGAGEGPLSTIIFDIRCYLHALRRPGVILLLGYNTALLSLILKIFGKTIVTNMDGIEWKRQKWGLLEKLWLYINERAAIAFSDSLIADHPIIQSRLSKLSRKNNTRMIPYGADSVSDIAPDIVRTYGLNPKNYLLTICRIEPENNILPMITAFVRNPRGMQFACVGKLRPAENAYHAEVARAAGGHVTFLGAIYDGPALQALRFHAAVYCHGHSVGGTNPSLVEAMGAGNAIVAHDNLFNRWVAGPEQFYFQDVAGAEAIFHCIAGNPAEVRAASAAARSRHEQLFQWLPILTAYEDTLRRHSCAGRPT